VVILLKVVDSVIYTIPVFAVLCGCSYPKALWTQISGYQVSNEYDEKLLEFVHSNVFCD
jgi:hypothetical protein